MDMVNSVKVCNDDVLQAELGRLVEQPEGAVGVARRLGRPRQAALQAALRRRHRRLAEERLVKVAVVKALKQRQRVGAALEKEPRARRATVERERQRRAAGAVLRLERLAQPRRAVAQAEQPRAALDVAAPRGTHELGDLLAIVTVRPAHADAHQLAPEALAHVHLLADAAGDRDVIGVTCGGRRGGGAAASRGSG